MVTKEECEKALETLSSPPYESSCGGCICGVSDCGDCPNNKANKLLNQLIDEHFSNPPLKFEELKEGMLVYDKNIKSWIEIDKTFEDIEKYVSCWSIGWPYEKRFPYEPNRFYRKEV